MDFTEEQVWLLQEGLRMVYRNRIQRAYEAEDIPLQQVLDTLTEISDLQHLLDKGITK